MILSLLLAAGSQLPPPPPIAFGPASPSPIVITQDNVDLSGAGTFSFKPSPNAFTLDPPSRSIVSLVVRLWLDANGRQISCETGKSPLRQAAQTGCAQLMHMAKFRMAPGMALPFRRGFVDVVFYFTKNLPKRPPGLYMGAMAVPGYANTAIIYPPDTTPPDRMLRKSDGALKVTVTADDYPPIANDYHLQSHSSVVLGISRDGKVQSCRPVTGPVPTRTAFLDNYTCTFLPKHAHFEFPRGAPAYAGLHYWRQSMRWVPGQ